jgi:hypothetical protein
VRSSQWGRSGAAKRVSTRSRDSEGRMWYASSVNNKVGYFYFNDEADSAGI